MSCSELLIELSEAVRNNGSLHIHTVILPRRKSRDELTLQEASRLRDATYIKNHLTQYAVPKSYAFNLLKDQSKEQSVKPVTHVKSKYGILMCADELNIPNSEIPMEIVRLLRVNRQHEFLPIAQEDFMQARLKDLVEITDDVKSAEVVYSYKPVSIGKLRFFLQIEATLKQFLALGFTEKDLDELKGVFVDTNLYLLCATIFIGSVHVSHKIKHKMINCFHNIKSF